MPRGCSRRTTLGLAEAATREGAARRRAFFLETPSKKPRRINDSRFIDPGAQRLATHSNLDLGRDRGRKAAEEAIDVYRAATKGEKNRTGAVRFVNEKDKDEKELLPPPRRRRTAASAAKKEEKATA
jgi:hypothetical protein